MSNELTAEEYRNLHRPLYGSEVVTYGDLRAKEAVEKFARELIDKYEKDYRSRVDERIIVAAVRSEHIKHLAKQHGVNL